MRVAVQLIEDEVAIARRLERGAVEDVAVGLADVFHRERLCGFDRRGQSCSRARRDSVELRWLESRWDRATAEWAAAVTPVALAMMSRKAMYLGVGRPLSSSGAS